ncbi:NAD-glutamate dehydrogenase domain-containing protein, partial [Kitasatospora cineracea]
VSAISARGSISSEKNAVAASSEPFPRGAWESVKRNFRELGVDTQSEDFTVIGIGDMSGDVFGNGMLLSEHIRLVAAFDHRHIFLDPNPDAAASYAERRRLFDLPRSSWDDYDKSLISAGGGVYPRSAKAIQLSAQVRERLGIDAAKLTPAELMKAILQAPVDLFWNGGIGTYVKASAETNAEVGDKANDAIRVNGGDVRARVIGEGGNLGCTQLGRIEFASTGGPQGNGGWIDTDAIDNSAGVDTSDHEVNIKILLNQVVADGDMTVKQRNALLAEMTDEVGHLVLRNNYAQNVVLANAVAQAASMVNVHSRMINRLESNGQLDRALEYLPTEKQIRDRQQAGRGLSQPELSVLLAYTKITLADELLATDLPDDPYFRDVLHAYFPSALRARFAEQIDHHPLRREIITTLIVNDTINRGGCTFAFRLREETGATMEEIARTHAAARAVFGLEQIWDQVERLDNQVAARVQTKMRLHSRRLVERATRWMLNNRQPLDIADTIAFFHDRVNQVWDALPKPLTGEDLAWFESVHQELSAAGVPDELATRIAGLSSAFPTLDIVGVADRSDTDVMEVAELYYDLGDRLQISHLLDRVIDLPRTDRWSSMARAAIREDLFAAHSALTADVLAAGPAGSSPEERYTAWAALNGTLLSRARTTLDDIRGSDNYELSSLSVAMRVIRTLLRNGR